eukprot:3960834-Prymnesium_polylepis.1
MWITGDDLSLTNGSSIVNTSSDTHAGAVYATWSSRVTLEPGSLISNTRARDYGGAVYIDQQSFMRLAGTLVADSAAG